MPIKWAQAGCSCGASNKAMMLFISDGSRRAFSIECPKCGQVMLCGQCVDQAGLLDRVKLPKAKPAKTVASAFKAKK